MKIKKRVDVGKELPKIFNALFSRFGPQGWWPARTRFEIIVGAILTQNTSWKNVERAIARLRAKRLLSIHALASAPLAEVRECVKPAGYFNQKAARVKEIAQYLDKNYGGDLARFFSQPTGSLRRELLALKGVGPETADSILLYAGGKPVFVVDAYTRRVFTRLGFLKGNESYEEIRAFFETNSGTPARKRVAVFNEFHALVVELAKSFCLKENPLCGDCPLRANCKL